MSVDLLKKVQSTEIRSRLGIEKGLELRGMVSETGKAPSYGRTCDRNTNTKEPREIK